MSYIYLPFQFAAGGEPLEHKYAVSLFDGSSELLDMYYEAATSLEGNVMTPEDTRKALEALEAMSVVVETCIHKYPDGCPDWMMALPCTDPRMRLDLSRAGSARYRLPAMATLTSAMLEQPAPVRERMSNFKWAARMAGNFILAVGFYPSGALRSTERVNVVGDTGVMLWPELRNTVVGGILE